jgi:hypothetical protein
MSTTVFGKQTVKLSDLWDNNLYQRETVEIQKNGRTFNRHTFYPVVHEEIVEDVKAVKKVKKVKMKKQTTFIPLFGDLFKV